MQYIITKYKYMKFLGMIHKNRILNTYLNAGQWNIKNNVSFKR